MGKKISVIIKEPGRIPRHVNISDTLENLQKTVGGGIETVTICTDFVIICDKDSRNKGKEHCCTICGRDFCGTVIMCAADEDEFCDLPYSFSCMKKLVPALWQEVK